MDQISLTLYAAGAIAFLASGIVLLRNRAKLFDPVIAVAAQFALAAWLGTLAFDALNPLPAHVVFAAELERAIFLLVFLHRTLRGAAGFGFTPAALTAAVLLAIAIPAVIAVAYLAVPAEPGSDFVLFRAWCGVFVSVGLLIGFEQVVRNAGAPLELLRFTCVALGVTVVYDLFMFADMLVFETHNIDTWRARGGVNAIAALFMSVVVSRSRIVRAVSFSRSVVFYTASLTLAGVFLLTISIVGYTVRKLGGSWGSALQVMLLFAAVLLAIAALLSRRLRDRLRVYVSKNFFALRYDYREEWLRLISALSVKGSEGNLYVRAIEVLANLYKCPGGLLWLRQEDRFVVVAPCRMRQPEGCDEPANSAFCRKLAEGWIFNLDEQPPAGVELPHLPSWIVRTPDLGIVMPLLVEDELAGFVGLQRSLGFSTLAWEDLDVLKTSARQVASYIARHQSAEELARARQFDTYHQLTAFIIHDLKNLIAQLELVVKNAAKHKENPAFVKDAIDTIQNSVARMGTLMGKLQHHEPMTRRPVFLQEVLIEAAGKCQSLKPKPALRIERPDLRVLADRDHLVMIISHIIKNAQEATHDDGFVDVKLHGEDGVAVIEVEDNGHGMEPEFVRTRLFKPFESTKTGKGMGIGAYQAREFVRSLGGDIRVSSKPGIGSTFTLTIPLSGAVATDNVEASTQR